MYHTELQIYTEMQILSEWTCPLLWSNPCFLVVAGGEFEDIETVLIKCISNCAEIILKSKCTMWYFWLEVQDHSQAEVWLTVRDFALGPGSAATTLGSSYEKDLAGKLLLGWKAKNKDLVGTLLCAVFPPSFIGAIISESPTSPLLKFILHFSFSWSWWPNTQANVWVVDLKVNVTSKSMHFSDILTGRNLNAKRFSPHISRKP